MDECIGSNYFSTFDLYSIWDAYTIPEMVATKSC